ncbi:MAG: mannose-1-phosphate guanylyltransferase/mannose-6-phosphate isomerase [Thermoanaerobaculaceae bacterium]|jgi:mannose-1-phosphate guanylyltransferase/mannose-6-phosphate isomerase
MSTIVPVILCGGSGTRLWPLSREAYPKQFLALAAERPLLQATVLRLEGLSDIAAPMAVCSDEHRFIVAEQLRDVGVVPAAIILEPVGRGTAPAVAVAALRATAAGADPLLLVLAADHIIRDAASFRAGVVAAVPAAEAGHLLTFGIAPTAPETGYGYIRCGGTLLGEARRVEQFVEKPDRPTAEAYVASGNYLWNSGMFLFRASAFLEELARFRPEMLASCREALAGAKNDLDFLRPAPEALRACASDSIDYAVMERTARAGVVPLSCGWSDVGSFSALWETGLHDEFGNVLSGDVLAVDTKNSLVLAQRLVATLAVEDMVVVDTPDAVLVARKDRVQDVRGIVERLRAAGRDEWRHHRKIYRPWGSYVSIDAAERFQVKRITVSPGAALSLQKHHYRAEHWVVVQGTARVTRGDEVFTLVENESTYIPLGVIHRLENPGLIPLELIEVQSGSYLGEDDVVRLEDNYGRNEPER